MKRLVWHFVILIVVAMSVVFYKAGLIPGNLAFDEVEFAKLALSLDNKPYTPYSPIAFGHSTFYFYILLLSFKIFGVTNFALRLPSAVFGVAGVIVFYLIMRMIFSDRKNLASFFPFLASLILITSRWYVNFARFSFEATFLLFLELLSIYFLLVFFKNKKVRNIVLCGIFAGFAFLSYQPGRLFFLLPFFFLITKSLKQYIILYLLAVFLIASPLLFYLAKHPDYRFREVAAKKPSVVIESVRKTALSFVARGDMNGRHNFPGKPALNPIMGIFFIAGLALSIKNFSLFHNRLMIGYFVLSLVPAVFTVSQDNPNMLRSFTVLPSIVYFITYPLSFIKKRFLLIAAVLLILLSSLYELRTYFMFQSRVFKNSFEVKCNLRQLRAAYPEIFDTNIRLKVGSIPKKCWVQKNEF